MIIVPSIMANEHVIELTAANFSEKVLQSSLPVLVDFWAEWCGPCKQIAPLIDALASEHAGKVVVGKVNVDQAPDLAAQFNIRSIPTLLIFQGGAVKDQHVGLTSKKDLERRLGIGA